jgi:hypothetical protein
MKKLILGLTLLLMMSALTAQGSFNIEDFTNPEKYGWKTWEDRMNYRNDLSERQKLLQIYEIEAQSISGNVFKSSVFPGWGQFNAKYYTKGQVFLAIELAMLGASYFFYDKSRDNYEKYRNATQIDEMNAYYHDALVPYQYSVVFLAFASVVWVYNVFDVVQTTEKYNAEVWQNTVKRHYKAPVQVTPKGIEVRF